MGLVQSQDVTVAQSGPSCVDDIQLVRPDEVDKVLQYVWHTEPNLAPCPSWVILSWCAGLIDWVQEEVIMPAWCIG